MAMNHDSILAVSDVWKKFQLHRHAENTLKGSIVHYLRRDKRKEDFWALKGVSFRVERGEAFGIVGRNGSGKSTLLKLLVGILQPTKGKIHRQGRISPLLELGAGFHPEFTGRENVFLNGAILGLSRFELKKRYEDIVKFAGLEHFMDTPVKHYSGGMYLRLGFSVAINVDPEILIIDEILAVGDEEFQGKCYERIHEMKKNGTTLVLVSHDLGSISNLCERAVWVDKGTSVMEGDAGKVANEYLMNTIKHREDTIRGDDDGSLTTGFGERWGTGEVRAQRIRLLGDDGREKTLFEVGEPFVLEIGLETTQRVNSLQVGLAIQTMSSLVLGTNTGIRGILLPGFNGRMTVRYHIPSLPLNSGEYNVSVAVQNPDRPGHDYDYHNRMYVLRVGNPSDRHNIGILNVEDSWDFCEGWIEIDRNL